MVAVDPAVRFVERMGGALADAGLPPLPARVFSALLVDDDGRMTAAELGDTLGVSSGGVSGATTYLVQLGLVHRERERGSRRDVFVVDDDAWHEAMLRSDQRYTPLLAALGSTLAALAEDHPARHRLTLTREFLSFVERELDQLAQRWEEHRRTLDPD